MIPHSHEGMVTKFCKMHGLGNDFVIFDRRSAAIRLSPEQIRNIADRRRGVGCDQLVIMEKTAAADIFILLYNNDGSETHACGNATRCVAWLLMEELHKDEVVIHTKAGFLTCKRVGDHQVSVDMGAPKLAWSEIPLARECDTSNLPMDGAPSAVSMGNPHLIFIVEDAAAIDLAKEGAHFEHHPLFPERANVSFAQILTPSRILLRVWERGAGATLACGTAACATLVALNRRGAIGRKATVELPGGALEIELNEANRIIMSGAVAISFTGELKL